MRKGLVCLAASAALLTVSVVQAEAARDWKVLGKDDKKIHYLYEPQSLKVEKGILSAWTSKQFRVNGDVRADGLPPHKYGGDRFTVSYQQFNCSEKKVRALTGVTYNDRGKPEGDVQKTEFAPVETGSPDAYLLEGLCKIAQGLQEDQKKDEAVTEKKAEKKPSKK